MLASSSCWRRLFRFVVVVLAGLVVRSRLSDAAAAAAARRRMVEEDAAQGASSLPSGRVLPPGSSNPHPFPATSSEAELVEKLLALLSASEDASGTERMPGIVGGELSGPNEFPFLVLAERAKCGGSLVAKDVVMTAAHCQGTQKPSDPRHGPLLAPSSSRSTLPDLCACV
jgi:Trypsin